MEKFLSDESLYFDLMKKYKGLFQVKVKFPVIDKKSLALVYTPGVAASCLEINKNISDSYKYTNKLNSMLLITDGSSGCFDTKDWNDHAPIPYLEGISLLYKRLTNIDCYPLVIKKGEVKDQEEFNELINKISLGFSAVEFFNVNEETVRKFNEAKNSNNEESITSKFVRVSSIDKFKIDSKININVIYAIALRVSLDCQSYVDIDQLIDEMIKYSNSKLDFSLKFSLQMFQLFEFAFDFIDKNQLINKNSGNYNLTHFTVDKNYVLKQFEKYITEGERGWVLDFPMNYNAHKESNDKNSLLLHQRYKGVISTDSKIPFKSVEEMMRILNFENFKRLSDMIIKDSSVAREMTCNSNYGSIITNGTAILGLGDIGALAGLPVMEGKSVLFKLFGGTDIMPLCIQEKDQEKFVRLVSLITPIYSIINLEDIRSPECFYIEPKLNKMVDYPVFHDDQHGTAIVVLAGLINSLKLVNKKIDEIKVVMNGAGAAGLSVAKLLITYGVKHFIICDTKGAIYRDRKDGMNEFKLQLAMLSNENQVKGSLEEVIKGADVFIGLSSGGALTKDMVKTMGEKSIVFALANPTPEIYPKDAFSAGAYIVATGRSDFPNQLNNSMAFPGIFRAAVDCNLNEIDVSMMIAAAEGISRVLKDDQIKIDNIVPTSMDTEVFVTVSKNIAETALKENKIRKKNINPEDVADNVESYFQEGYLRAKF